MTIALPLADFVWGEDRIVAAEGAPPQRLVTYAMANGFPVEWWNYTYALSSLAPLQGKITTVLGLRNAASKNNDHIQGSGSLFVGKEPVSYTQSGGISLDQLAGEKAGGQTKLRSLVVGLWKIGQSALIETRRSFDDKGNPATPIVNPYDTFRELFGDPAQGLGPDELARRAKLDQSVLDLVVDEYKAATGARYGLSPKSRARLADHLDAVRDLERQAKAVSAQLADACKIPVVPANFAVPVGQIAYTQWAEIMDAQFALLAVALACDLTRAGSIMVGGSAENFFAAGVNTTSEHSLAHTKGTPVFDTEFLSTRRYQTELLRRFLVALDSVKEGDTSVLDNTVVIAGTEFNIAGNNDPVVHDSSTQPHLVAGGRALKLGAALNVGGQATNNDLYRTCLKAVGIEVDAVGPAENNGALIAALLK